MVTAQNNSQFKNKFFKHEKTGRIFRLILVTNEYARAIKRDKWPIMAVYEDRNHHIWSCPLMEFESKFVEIDVYRNPNEKSA